MLQPACKVYDPALVRAARSQVSSTPDDGSVADAATALPTDMNPALADDADTKRGSCGDGIVEEGELCDVAIAEGQSGACPSGCSGGDGCAKRMLQGSDCMARCDTVTITRTAPDDGCCPQGASATSDNDCSATCGNGVIEHGESCDPVDSCPVQAACVSDDACMTARYSGEPEHCTASCELVTVRACTSGDGCCPLGCRPQQDDDCAHITVPAVDGGNLHGCGDGCDALSDEAPAVDGGDPQGCGDGCDALIDEARAIDGGDPRGCGDGCDALIDEAPAVDDVPPCSRDALHDRAEAYLRAMAAGDVHALSLDASVRYTENGQPQRLGRGVWLERPQPMFARHVLDTTRCSSITEAVLSEPEGRIVFGVRLRYAGAQLLEAEAMIVYPNRNYYDPDALVPQGPDPWVEPIDTSARMSRGELMRLAMQYFDAATEPTVLPPHAPGCERLQNGSFLSGGSCGTPPGQERFEQQRYPVIDETTGIVTAIVVYNGFIGIYLIKCLNGEIQNIDIVGGAAVSSSGW